MAAENQPYELAHYGWIMHLVGAGLWLILGIYELYEYFRQSDLLRNYTDPASIEGISNDTVFLALILGILFIILAMMALIWSVLVKWRILEPLGRQEYEYAVRNIMMLAAPGLLFGFGAGGALLMLSFARMKDVMRPRPVQTAKAEQIYVAQATPICPSCGNAARFIHTQNRWHCDTCARYL
jgi:ribosomal protein S27AE